MGDRTDAGFTLVELLIVMVIIGVLIAIAYPTLSTVGGASRRSACLSNQRSLEQAILAYKADYNGASPTAVNDFEGYLKNIQSATKCPTDGEPTIHFDGTGCTVSCPIHVPQ